ncbi:MAG: hypothetical protein J5798_11440 [Spirochaetaceae bacterium]|nr:hypothetical protein [Spirochaetaceae bacterium]
MIFFNNEEIYYNCFDFLINEYGYKVASKNIKEGLWYSKFVLKHNIYPEITIEIEKSYLVVFMLIEGKELWSLPQIYKFLHHNEIVRGDYSSCSLIKKDFKQITRQYLDEILGNIDQIKNQNIKKFYDEFPPHVFVWK